MTIFSALPLVPLVSLVSLVPPVPLVPSHLIFPAFPALSILPAFSVLSEKISSIASLYFRYRKDTRSPKDYRKMSEAQTSNCRLKTEKYATSSPLSLLSPPTNPIISFVLPNLSNRQIVKLTNYHYLCPKNIHFFK